MGNRLTKVQFPANLSNLNHLDLSSNELTQLTLGDMPNLSSLYLSNNKLTQLTLGNILNLIIVDLSDNELTQVSLGNMPNLSNIILDEIPSVTAYNGDQQHIFQNPTKQTILNYIQTGNAYLVYVAGLGVHSNNRDEKMKELAQVFKEKIELDPMDINENFEDFEQYLKELEEKNETSKQLVQKAKFTLGLPVEEGSGFVAQGGFGPLLRGSVITAYDLNMTGKEFIARLWSFVSTYADPRSHNPKEEENAKYAMVASLAEAIEDKKRVCDAGKMQRLFTGVLQGRIEEVNTDGLTPEQLEPPKPTLSETFEIFKAGIDRKFKEESLTIINDPTMLRSEAEEFLKNNALVDANEFRKFIEKYIIDEHYGL